MDAIEWLDRIVWRNISAPMKEGQRWRLFHVKQA
jgi:hypothetical protein